ncbi:hypothetical protein GCM10010256_83490 [Streptomyces coeruleorubidus]|nr:hypothetical protein GCM10010256_83490 [Streptomyces coeruleorubidus]
MAGPPGHKVVGGDEVDGAAHEMGPNHTPPGQQFRQRRRFERPQPGPEPDERFLRFLRLETAQVGDGVEHRQVGAVEEQLPRESRAVERPGIENGQRSTSAFESCADPRFERSGRLAGSPWHGMRSGRDRIRRHQRARLFTWVHWRGVTAAGVGTADASRTGRARRSGLAHGVRGGPPPG